MASLRGVLRLWAYTEDTMTDWDAFDQAAAEDAEETLHQIIAAKRQGADMPADRVRRRVKDWLIDELAAAEQRGREEALSGAADELDLLLGLAVPEIAGIEIKVATWLRARAAAPSVVPDKETQR